MLIIVVQKKNLTHIPVDSNTKASFYYKPGTYWIYRDSLSGRIDSFYVKNNWASLNVQIDDNHCADYFYSTIVEKNIINIITNDSGIYNWQLEENGISFTKNQSNTSEYNLDYLPLFSYPFKVGAFQFIDGSSGSGNDLSYFEQILTNCNISGQLYNNVAIIPHHAIDSSYFDKFYLNADVGIIKMRLNHLKDSVKTKVWELQRWKIVK